MYKSTYSYQGYFYTEKYVFYNGYNLSEISFLSLLFYFTNSISEWTITLYLSPLHPCGKEEKEAKVTRFVRVTQDHNQTAAGISVLGFCALLAMNVLADFQIAYFFDQLFSYSSNIHFPLVFWKADTLRMRNVKPLLILFPSRKH